MSTNTDRPLPTMTSLHRLVEVVRGPDDMELVLTWYRVNGDRECVQRAHPEVPKARIEAILDAYAEMREFFEPLYASWIVANLAPPLRDQRLETWIGLTRMADPRR